MLYSIMSCQNISLNVNMIFRLLIYSNVWKDGLKRIKKLLYQEANIKAYLLNYKQFKFTLNEVGVKCDEGRALSLYFISIRLIQISIEETMQTA